MASAAGEKVAPAIAIPADPLGTSDRGEGGPGARRAAGTVGHPTIRRSVRPSCSDFVSRLGDNHSAGMKASMPWGTASPAFLHGTSAWSAAF